MREREPRGEQMARVVAAIGTHHRHEAARQQRAANQQHAGDGDLADDDGRPHAGRPRPHREPDGGDAVFGQAAGERRRLRQERRHQPADDADGQCHRHREHDASRIEAHVFDAWEIGRQQRGQEPAQRRGQCHGNANSRGMTPTMSKVVSSR
jgi:hypothetical protein